MTELSPIDRKKLQIEILLQEYQSCHDTRNHYDNIRWIIGSIFIGASLTLFGLSLDKSLDEVLLAFLFSLSSIMVWYFYAQHVNHYIVASIIRCHNIEKYFRKELEFKIELHKSINEMDDTVPKLKGTIITFSLILMVVVVWFIRIVWSMYASFDGLTGEFIFWFIVLGFISSVFLIGLWVLHNKYNPINVGKKIRVIWKDC